MSISRVPARAISASMTLSYKSHGITSAVVTEPFQIQGEDRHSLIAMGEIAKLVFSEDRAGWVTLAALFGKYNLPYHPFSPLLGHPPLKVCHNEVKLKNKTGCVRILSHMQLGTTCLIPIHLQQVHCKNGESELLPNRT